MKVLILAGGYGTRISEETGIRPKPMVNIGDHPILWHIMKSYSHYGFNDFIVLCGYKGNVIKEYFANYYLNKSNVVFDLANNSMEALNSQVEPWRVTLLDTGQDTMTGGRILRAKEYLDNEPFLLTYGDGLSDIDISNLIEAHKKSGKKVTLTAVQPQGRYGALELANDDSVIAFREKQKGDGGWINGGFFVCEPDLLSYISEGDESILERAPLENLAKAGQLNCYKHHGFWKCMDTLADKNALNQIWIDESAPWKVWT